MVIVVRNCTGSKQWWLFLSCLTKHSFKGRLAVPSATQLAGYFSSKLSCLSTQNEPPILKDCHHSLFRQFQIKKFQVGSTLLLSLDVHKSVGDDDLSPRVWSIVLNFLVILWSSYFIRYTDNLSSLHPRKSAALFQFLKRIHDLILFVIALLQCYQLYHESLNDYWFCNCSIILILIYLKSSSAL